MKEKGHPEYNYKDKSRPVPKSSKFSKSRTFNTLKTKEKEKKGEKNSRFFFQILLNLDFLTTNLRPGTLSFEN